MSEIERRVVNMGILRSVTRRTLGKRDVREATSAHLAGNDFARLVAAPAGERRQRQRGDNTDAVAARPSSVHANSARNEV
jgi:hypothetical protein